MAIFCVRWQRCARISTSHSSPCGLFVSIAIDFLRAFESSTVFPATSRAQSKYIWCLSQQVTGHIDREFEHVAAVGLAERERESAVLFLRIRTNYYYYQITERFEIVALVDDVTGRAMYEVRTVDANWHRAALKLIFLHSNWNDLLILSKTRNLFLLFVCVVCHGPWRWSCDSLVLLALP